MAKAGTREKQFIDLCSKIDPEILSGKISFEDTEGVYVSVDNSIVLENEIILIEIDASNQAKLVAGQYTLLNILKSKPSLQFQKLVGSKNLIFFVIHCYGNVKKKLTKYNPNRSKKNFRLIKENCFFNRGIKYGSIHIDELTEKNIKTKRKLINFIKKNILD